MNKIIYVNLSGRFFYVDEAAYALLNDYLEKLKITFQNTPGKEEIIGDIEARITELFETLKKQENQVIGKADVESIIETLGQPEDYITEDDTTVPPQSDFGRKLFRDPDDRYIGGVAAGLAHYFRFDVSWIRIIWAVLLFFSGGTFLIIYVLLWALVPEASTTAEKLQMRGEPVNISTIGKKIKDEFDQFSSRVKDAVEEESRTGDLKKKSRNFFSALARGIIGLFSLIGIFLGILIVFTTGIALMCGFIVLLVTTVVGATSILPVELVSMAMLTDVPFWLLAILTSLVVLIPLIFLFLLGVRLLAPKSKLLQTTVLLILLGMWVVAIAAMGVVSIGEFKEHRFEVELQDTEMLPLVAPQDTLQLTLGPKMRFYDRVTDNDDFDIIVDNNNTRWLYSDDVRIDIQPSTSDSLSLTVQKEANGKSYSAARLLARNIKYNYHYKDNQLAVNEYLTADPQDKFHQQEVKLTLMVSEGQLLYIDKKLARMLYNNIKNDQDFYRRKIAGHLWRMGKEELQCMDCPRE